MTVFLGMSFGVSDCRNCSIDSGFIVYWSGRMTTTVCLDSRTLRSVFLCFRMLAGIPILILEFISFWRGRTVTLGLVS
ncbi:hypothetical protein O6P43_013023 [Quillaja saponaria]|uniref:Uncharacterized protein n=1 Tax=Quillaja saponaria TaxID=32244 RepID=A0AAD7M396_QUISA|nr:hypothetical protein O6P43_013023 [Quillaja saponaria]